ncbi:MAG: hypothetical protein AVDCRST_MAG07-2278 [uncultured Frankineae bacterium]|uniref:Uncharacterized protein n=1 Tax=uncultured Frankineae bacterium TaxID=437475 RepID=A0A6J4LSK8_9ACTN|nr:MAG: hypothetical protein AVDCRST_MAG07-2278 [uncultured Frankineae bacterium]
MDAAPLRAAGWAVRGALAGEPWLAGADQDQDPSAGPGSGDGSGSGHAGSYATLDDLLSDAHLDAVAVDGDDADLAGRLPALRAAGLLLLLPTPAPLDAAAVRDARAVAEPAEAAVGLRARWQPWALTVAAALPLVGTPAVQVTVRGWPRGRGAAAELVDLVASWCGDVAAVAAVPAPLPADSLPDGCAVSWALLTGSGATVLVSHDGPVPQVRLSFATARLEAGPAGARWTGGAALPLLGLPAWVPPARGSDPALVATAAALARARGGADIPTSQWPWPADLGDLLVAARVLEALRTSARTERLVPVA